MFLNDYVSGYQFALSAATGDNGLSVSKKSQTGFLFCTAMKESFLVLNMFRGYVATSVWHCDTSFPPFFIPILMYLNTS